ncbi:MAG: hypothetical protein IJQ82_14455 [Selenomonadaceae bacterium]|nr:hypothetical protein [Selenomonadaceae bacterium]
MALEFTNTNVATIKAKSTEGAFISTPGVTTDTITPAQAATQINKILAIGGKAIVADINMTRTRGEEVVDNG